MGKYEEIYQKLRKEYSDEEIADSMLLPADLTPEEQEQANKELRAFRFKLLAEMTEEQRIYADLLRFRYQLDNYIDNEAYNPLMRFGVQLEEYTRILKRTKKKLSEDLGIHYTKLSRIINDREEPNLALMYRLEEHSGSLVPALIWWKLVVKKQEFEIARDKETRKTEATKVKNAIANSTTR
jgi:plasmid maintenance system antidote protein VapI